MIQRLYQVCLTYVMRWSSVLVALGYLAACGMALVATWFPRPVELQGYESELTNVFPELPQPGPTVNLAAPQTLDEVDQDARSVFWTAQKDAPIQTNVSRPFPNLMSLQVVGELDSQEDLSVLKEMPQLDSLSLLTDLTPAIMENVGQLGRLRYLRLLELDRATELGDLGRLSNLRTLDVLRVPDHARLFDQIRQIPNLRTLVLSGQVAAIFNPADWERLRDMPQLTHLYLRGNAKGSERSRIELDRVRQMLPRVKVRPASVSSRRSNAWKWIVVASTLIWGVLMTQLQSHFSHSASRLIPSFASAHLAIAASLCSVTTAIQTAILWHEGCSLAASLAGSLMVQGCLWWIIVFLMRLENLWCTAFMPGLAQMACVQITIVSTVASPFSISDVDWFLSGKQPLLAWVIVAGCVVSPILVFRRVPRLHNAFQEMFGSLPPLGTSMKGWQPQNLAAMQQAQAHSQHNGPSGLFNRLDTLLASPDRADRSELWIAGNMLNGRFLACAAVCIGALMACTIIGAEYFQILPYVAPLRDTSILPLMALYGIDLVTLGLIAGWRERLLVFGYEMLRPMSRSEFVQQIFAAVARDMRPLLSFHLIAMGILISINWSRGFLPYFFPVLLCYILFRALFLYSAVLFFLTVRNGWIQGFGMIAGYFVLAIPVIYFIVCLGGPTEVVIWNPVLAIFGIVAGIALVSLFLMWLKGYWQRIELA